MALQAWATSANGGGPSDVYRFNGTAWSYVRSVQAPTGGCNCTPVFALDPNNSVWVGCGVWSYSTRIYFFNGSTWVSWDIPNFFVRRIWGTSNTNMYACGYESTAAQGEVWRYDGVSWSRVFQTSGQSQLQTMIGESANSIWAVGGQRVWQGARDATRFNGASWSIDDAGNYSDGEVSDFVIVGLHHANGQYYFCTRTNLSLMKLYTRVGVGVGQWVLHSAVPTTKYTGSGNQTWGKTLFVAGTKIFVMMLDEVGTAGEVWLKDGGAAWSNVTPAGGGAFLSIHGDSSGNLWLAGRSSAGNRHVWLRDVTTGIWTAYDISGLPGSTPIVHDIWTDADRTPPYLTGQTPAPGSIDISQSASVSLDILDLAAGVNPVSVVLKLGGVDAWKNDAQEAGFTVSKTVITNGFRYNISGHPLFPSLSLVEVGVYAEDLVSIPNVLDTSYTFQTKDEEPPVLDSNSPSGSGVNESTPVSFSAKDYGTGVDLSTVQATIGGTVAVLNGVPVGVWAAGSSVTPNIWGGYDFSLISSSLYDSYQNYDVHVECDDLEVPPNHRELDWSFQTRNYLGPLVHPTQPEAGEVEVPVDTNIVVEVTDHHLVTSGSVRVRVNKGAGWILAYQQGDPTPFKDGWDGPASQEQVIPDGYRVTIDPTEDFPVTTLIQIEISADDPEGNPERLG